MPAEQKRNASWRRQFLKRAAGGVAILSGIAPLASPADALLGPPGELDMIDAGDKQNASRLTKPLVVDTPSGADLALQVLRDSDLRNHPDVLAYVEFSSAGQVLADLGRSNWYDATHRAWYAISNLVAASGALPAGASFPVPDPEFIVDRDLPFMRFSGGNVNPRLIAAQLFAGPGIRHAFCRYVLVVESDVPLYMTELGVKLPGFAGEYEDTILNPPHAGTQTFSWRMEHGPKNDIDLRDYLYDGTTGSGFGNVKQYGPTLPIGVPMVIEQELDVDAKHGRVFLNGVLVGERDVITDVDIEMLFLNIYHGGTGLATQPIHYRLAAACIAKSYIGVPRELRAGPPAAIASASGTGMPAWRQGLPVGEWTELPGTSLAAMTGNPGAPNPNAWCGFAAASSAWWSVANGGHTDSSDNGVYAIDFTAEAPTWRVVRDASAIADRTPRLDGQPTYYADGRPNARHTYYNSVFCAPRNRILLPMCLGGYLAVGSASMDGFSIDAGDYDPRATYPDCPAVGNGPPQPSVCADPRSGDIYVGEWTKPDWYKWDCATNTWDKVGTICTRGYWGCMIDTKRNRLVMSADTAHDASAATLPYFDLASKASGSIATGITQPVRGPSVAIVHDPDVDLYYWIDSSATMYIIDPDTGATTPLTTDVPAPVNGVWNRFAYFGAPIYGIAYYPYYSANVWFMPTA